MASTSTYRLRGSSSAASSSSSSSSAQFKYDVFLSFRGEDTRGNFTDHLYDKLRWRGIKAFRDDPDLDRGTVISSELLAAIEQSRFAVVVLSPNYASSSWCLLELVKIVACMGERRKILPVFIDVDPSDIRHQRGSFKEAFAEHEDKFADDLNKVQEWRDALRKVANVAGWSSKDYRYETDLIKEIVEAVWKEVAPILASSESEILQNLVGIDSKLMEIEFLLDTNINDVCFIGIWGMGGIGKTTLARQVLKKISHHFEVTLFLPDVRQISTIHGLAHQQEQLLCQIMKEKNIQVHNVYEGVAKIKRCLFEKKVLLVLDDVNKSDQLENLAGGKDWFGSGSIIIMTTRDRHLLVSHGVEKRYKCKGLNQYEALQLFCWKAFKKDYPEEGYMELSKSILDYSRGLPLALKILGSFLYKRDQGDWESTVTNLKRAPIDQVLFRALRISYDGLNKIDQQVFLDVACFLKGSDKERVMKILDSCFGLDTRVLISVLIERSLITIFDNRVDMHDLIQEMGREIVRLESEQEPGKRSQLWLHDDIRQVLKENTGTQAIRSIAICLPKFEELSWNPDAFSSMCKLKFIKMQNLVLCPGPKYLPRDLRVLEWNLYPAKSLPLNFQPLNLIELILHHSKIHHLWHGIKYLNKLTIMDLSFSDNLTETPDFTGIQNLERLVLEGCTNLVYIHPSIKSLRRLKILSLKNCRSITSFPGELKMFSLELLDLSGCSRVNTLPRSVRLLGWIQKLSELCLSGIGKQKVSYNSVHSHVLDSWEHSYYLKALHLSDCKLGEEAISAEIGLFSSLENLDLSANNFITLPESIRWLSKLKCLNLADCKSLERLPCLPSFCGTCCVTADNCISLKKVPDPPELCRLWKLSFSFVNCHSLKDGGIEGGGGIEEDSENERSFSSRHRQMHPCRFENFFKDVTNEDENDQYSFVCSGGVTIEDDIDDGGFEVYGSFGDYGYTSYIIYSLLQNFLQKPPPYFEMFSIVVPGDHIPSWFKNISVRHSPLRQAPPDCSSCSSKWIGYALCVLLGAEENSDALGEDHANTISCSWKPGLFIPASFSFHLNQVIQYDHLCVFLLPSKHYLEHTNLTDPNFIDFLFQAGAGLKVKEFGVRTLYKQELKELELRQRQYEECSFDWHWRSDVVEPLFSRVVPGNEIPVWFGTRGKQDSVSVERPCISCCNTWAGFALCVLFGAEEISGELPNDDLGEGLPTRAHKIWCCWKASNFSLAKYSCVVSSSDHLCVFFIPVDKFLHLPKWVDFEFTSDAYMKVKGYGVRSLYMHDLPGNLAYPCFQVELLLSIISTRSSRGG